MASSWRHSWAVHRLARHARTQQERTIASRDSPYQDHPPATRCCDRLWPHVSRRLGTCGDATSRPGVTGPLVCSATDTPTVRSAKSSLGHCSACADDRARGKAGGTGRADTPTTARVRNRVTSWDQTRNIFRWPRDSGVSVAGGYGSQNGLSILGGHCPADFLRIPEWLWIVLPGQRTTRPRTGVRGRVFRVRGTVRAARP